MSNHSDGYDVGYGKPPKSTQFKPGQSGNPKGRPTGTRNLKTDLLEELSEKVQVTTGGSVQTVSKQRAILMRTFELALKGNMRAVELITKLVSQHQDDTATAENDQPLSVDEEKILADFVEQQMQLNQGEEPIA